MNSINYWENFSAMNEMVTAHDNKMYPPRFRYVFSGGDKNEKVKFVFTGLERSQLYEVSLATSVLGKSYNTFPYVHIYQGIRKGTEVLNP